MTVVSRCFHRRETQGLQFLRAPCIPGEHPLLGLQTRLGWVKRLKRMSDLCVAVSPKWWKTWLRLLLTTTAGNRKQAFNWYQFRGPWTTLNDRNAPLAHYLHFVPRLPQPAVLTRMKTGRYCMRQKDSPMSANLKFVHTLWGVRVVK